jgi:hypothetical protein
VEGVSRTTARAAPIAGAASLVLVLAASWALPADPGEALTRNTIRLALLWYAAALALLLLLSLGDWTAQTSAGRLARDCWTIGWAVYVVHVLLAFHHYHHWSHAQAMEHVYEQSGVGEGVYVSYLFTLVWTGDMLWWRLWPQGYATRSPWIDRVLHGFMLFVVFNATVVYETGVTRWAGVALFEGLARLAVYRCRQPTSPHEPSVPPKKPEFLDHVQRILRAPRAAHSFTSLEPAFPLTDQATHALIPAVRQARNVKPCNASVP